MGAENCSIDTASVGCVSNSYTKARLTAPGYRTRN